MPKITGRRAMTSAAGAGATTKAALLSPTSESPTRNPG
jgi:hypothetical protein